MRIYFLDWAVAWDFREPDQAHNRLIFIVYRINQCASKEEVVMAHDSLLSVCIPTHGRASSLKECLNSLLPQVKPYRIPIYVSDNASTDDTMRILASFKNESYPFLYFRSNDMNLGFDRNLVNAIGMSSSKYVWPLADRFKLMPISITKIYKILSQNDLDLLRLRVQRGSHTFNQADTDQTRSYKTARGIFINDGHNLTLLGLHILPTRAWMSRIKSDYVGPGFVHFNVLFDYLASLKSIKAMRTEWSSIYGIKSVRSCWCENADSIFRTWLVDWVKAVNALPKAYSNNDKELVVKSGNHYVFSAAQLFDLRSEHLYCLKVYNKHREALLKYTDTSSVNARLISVLPVPAINFLKKVRSHFDTDFPLNPLRIMHLMRTGQSW